MSIKDIKIIFISIISCLLLSIGYKKYQDYLALKAYNAKYNYRLHEQENALVKINDYNTTKLFFEPYNDGNYYTVPCIDISGFQEEIDFNKVKEVGIDYVYIRIGSRGYTKGALYEDGWFDKNYEQAKAAGLKVGTYFFSQSITINEAIEEAFFVEQHLNGRELDLEVVYDFEYIGAEGARADKLSNELKSDMALAFCQKIEEFGYKPMIYANYDQLTNYYNLERVMNYPIWYAEYDVKVPTWDKEYVMWQFTPSGEVPGITGDVDLNYKIIKIGEE